MAKKISLWILTLYHPIIKSTTIEKQDEEDGEGKEEDKNDKDQGVNEIVNEWGVSSSFTWTASDQEADTLVNTSLDIGQRERKESIGGGIIVREQLIRDLE